MKLTTGCDFTCQPHAVLVEETKVDSLWCMYAWFLAAKSARDQARGLHVDDVGRSQCHYCSKPFGGRRTASLVVRLAALLGVHVSKCLSCLGILQWLHWTVATCTSRDWKGLSHVYSRSHQVCPHVPVAAASSWQVYAVCDYPRVRRGRRQATATYARAKRKTTERNWSQVGFDTTRRRTISTEDSWPCK